MGYTFKQLRQVMIERKVVYLNKSFTINPLLDIPEQKDTDFITEATVNLCVDGLTTGRLQIVSDLNLIRDIAAGRSPLPIITPAGPVRINQQIDSRSEEPIVKSYPLFFTLQLDDLPEEVAKQVSFKLTYKRKKYWGWPDFWSKTELEEIYNQALLLDEVIEEETNGYDINEDFEEDGVYGLLDGLDESEMTKITILKFTTWLHPKTCEQSLMPFPRRSSIFKKLHFRISLSDLNFYFSLPESSADLNILYPPEHTPFPEEGVKTELSESVLYWN